MISSKLRISLLARRAWLTRPAGGIAGQERFVTTTLWKLPSSEEGQGGSIQPLHSPLPVPVAIVVVPKHPQHQQQTVRWKRKSAKMASHLEVLDEMAHTQSREAAQERRQKKKERKLKKKKGKGGGAGAAAEESAKKQEEDLFDHDEDDDDDDDDDDEDEVELPDHKQIETQMIEIVKTFENSLKSIRGAEPTPEIFDDTMVNAYGSDNTSLKAVAQVVISSPTMATVTCFDPSLVKEVRDAIQFQLGLNPQTDSSEGDAGVLKVPLPKVSLETRQKTAQQLNKKAENYRLRIRRVRRRYNSIIKQGKDGKLDHISKDDVFRVAKEIDDVTDKAIKKLNDVTDKKHASIMDV